MFGKPKVFQMEKGKENLEGIRGMEVDSRHVISLHHVMMMGVKMKMKRIMAMV